MSLGQYQDIHRTNPEGRINPRFLPSRPVVRSAASISSGAGLLLPVKVLSRLFRRLMLEMLLAVHDAGRLQFFGDHAHLAGKAAFKAYLAPLHRTKWFVYR